MNNMQEEFKGTTRKLEMKFGETKRELEKQKEVRRGLEGKFEETKRELEKQKEVTKKLEDKVNVLENRLTQFPEEYTWKISCFSEVQSKAKSEEKILIHSPPFYYYGYKFRLQLHPNGTADWKATHLSLFFILMKGEYDAKLSWPFQGIVKFALVDQQEDADDSRNVVWPLPAFPQDSRNFVDRPLTDENIGWGFDDFVSLKKLTERCYIVDDTIFIQVKVAPETV